ncbi:MAG TPA: methyltransferase domain-containing protein [Alphaproteobacteria bacterium]|nr:methyltransferase domain-containing protein [Alphaproteobacteria bacterium]
MTIFQLPIMDFAQALRQTKENDNYLLETGKKDYERLLLLNEITNPYSIPFLKKYIKPGQKVLEVGCGIGLMSQEIAKIVGEKGSVTGTDLNEEQLAIAQDLISSQYLKRLHFQKASVYDLSEFRDNYDVVYVRFLFIHLEDVTQALDQIKGVLKPGGFLLVEELAGNNTIASDPKDARLAYVRKVDDLQEDLQKSNFTIAKILGVLLMKNGFTIISDQGAQPKLDTQKKRRFFSLGMKSIEEALVKNEKLTREGSQAMIKEVEKMEKDESTNLYFYKIGQIAARLLHAS